MTEDIVSYCYVADKTQFIQEALPVERHIINAVYQKLTHSGSKLARPIYNEETKAWNIPLEPKTEGSFCGTFVKVANVVRDAIVAVGCSEIISGIWLDRHLKEDQSEHTANSQKRPAILYGMGSREEHEDLERQITRAKQTEGDSPSGNRVNQVLNSWWLRVHVPVVVEPTNDPREAMDGLLELWEHMRRMFRIQFDRRFVFGLLFTKTDLSVWLADRSGILGMDQSFNIHKEPKLFIQVVLGLSTLDPERLGWDPTMRLCWPMPDSPVHHKLLHSYEPRVSSKGFQKSLYQTSWAIDMVSKDGKSRETFITVRALSLVKANIICGRAAIFWQAVKLADLLKEEESPKAYILKQCWRSDTGTSEGSFYAAAAGAEHIGQLYSHEDVCTRDGERVDTVTFVRCGLSHILRSDAPRRQNCSGGRSLGHVDGDERQMQYLRIRRINNGLRFSSNSGQKEPPCRIQNRLVIESYGWPIEFFRDLAELLRVTRDVIEGHKEIYYEGIVHGDLSVGNMLISPRDGTSTDGRLIDLNHAKTAPLSDPPSTPFSENEVNRLVKAANTLFELQMPKNVAILLLSRIKDACTALGFVEYCLQRNPRLGKQGDITTDDLNFHVEQQQIPVTWEFQTQSAALSAILPFASFDVWKGETMVNSEGQFAHSSVHDMQSVFWIVTYLCLTRSGPGGHIRDEFKQDVDPEEYPDAPQLYNLVNCFFESQFSSVLATNKKSLFVHDDYMSHVVPYFHSYFNPLKPLLEEWWQILRQAYKFGIFDTMQQQFLDAITRHFAQIAAMDGLRDHPATKEEDDRRSKDLQAVKDFAATWRTTGHGQPSVPVNAEGKNRATSARNSVDIHDEAGPSSRTRTAQRLLSSKRKLSGSRETSSANVHDETEPSSSTQAASSGDSSTTKHQRSITRPHRTVLEQRAAKKQRTQ